MVRVQPRMGDETRFRQVRAAHIAIGQLAPAQIQGARHARCHRTQALVQDVQARVPDWEANGDRVAAVVAAGGPVAHIHGGLGRSVQVVQRRIDAGMEAVAHLGRQGLAAAEYGLHPQSVAARLVEEGRQHRRHEMHHVHPFPPDQGGQRLWILVHVGLGHHQRSPAQHRQEQLPHRDIEGVGGFLQEALVRAKTVVLAHPQQPVDDGPVADHHPLGLAGAARGVDHIGRIGGLYDRQLCGIAVCRQAAEECVECHRNGSRCRWRRGLIFPDGYGCSARVRTSVCARTCMDAGGSAWHR